MDKLFRYCLLIVTQFLLIFLPVLAVYSFIKARKQNIKTRDNLQHISQHYFLTSLFHRWNKKNCIMIHAISLGEVDAAINLINSFEPESNENIILTVTSIQAYKKLHKNKLNLKILYFPFDSLIHQTLFLSHFHIKKAIIIEHDFWPNFLAVMNMLKREVILLNGHISDKTIQRLSNRYYRELMFSPIKNAYVQTDDLRTKLLHIMPDINVSVVPSYKLPLNIRVNGVENITSERKVIAISNFHPNELNTVNVLLSKLIHLDYKIILVPRHINFFDDFIQVIKKQYNNQVEVISECNNIENILSDIVFVKSYGVLNRIYSMSHASIVFGSFDSSLKGHSLFEPLLHGAMVYYGPHFSSQKYMDELLHSFIPDIQHDINSIFQQIESLTTQDRLRIYNSFVKTVEREAVILINHFREIEKWIRS